MIRFSAQSNTASRTSSGLPGAAVVDAGRVAHSVHQLGAPLVSLLPQVRDVLLGAAGEFGELHPGTGHRLRLLELG